MTTHLANEKKTTLMRVGEAGTQCHKPRPQHGVQQAGENSKPRASP